MVSHHFGMSVDELKDGKDEPRKMAIYLLKIHTDINNRQIGELLGGLSYSAVAKVIERFSAKVKLPDYRAGLPGKENAVS
jgi:chromosomal replication initiation ATPase DnaA